ncbi:MAG: hypothetical protein Q9225_001221, partial [Loekoesia sp. 1 TL-2023]
LFYVNRIFYLPTILAAKLTILFQLLRIFVPPIAKRGLIAFLAHTLIALNIVFYAANVLSSIFLCNPIEKAWNKFSPGTCVSANLNLVSTGSINVVSDVLILFLPLWSIWHLGMPIRERLGVSVVFAAGVLYAKSRSLQLYRRSGFTNGITRITSAIICSSLPLVPKVLSFVFPPNQNSHYQNLAFASTSSTDKLHSRSRARSGRRRGAMTQRMEKDKEEKNGAPVTGLYMSEDWDEEWRKERSEIDDGKE